MGTAIQTLFVGLNPKVIITPKPTADVLTPYLSSKTTYCSLKTRYRTHQFHQRVRAKQVLATQAVSSDVKDAEVSSPQFDDFFVTTTSTDKDNEIKISVEVFGAKTEAIFNNVFSKMVAAAQPIPGFQRTKGGKFFSNTQYNAGDPSNLTGKLDGKAIEGLAVSKDLKVEQSFEDLQAAFEPGDNFRFDAVVITSN
ncbi:hypothetical protein LguiB_027100 [Lonicera macranthoides]